ncbi:MAG: HD domain-containing protein [Candidatus Omnitrophica bacterium]|nr:HD domain-containing protein [Candidatus Omnitrophota bacterium]
MRKPRFLINSFQTKVTLAFVFCLLFIVGLSNLLMYEYSLNTQFDSLRDKLMVIARNAAVAVDADVLAKVPLNRAGINSPEYKIISENLARIKTINPSLRYIYTMGKTAEPGIWQFIVDPDPVSGKSNLKGPTAFPGDKYDVRRFPQMQQAFYGPVVDKDFTVDEWGVFLSGYAPVYNKEGKAIAVLGVDMNAERVYALQKTVKLRAFSILGVGVMVSIILGLLISRSVVKPVGKLVLGTRKIASGDLDYKVDIKGKDEIAELAESFNNMASSLSESRQKLEDYFYRVVQAMVRSLEAKHAYTKGHSDRVSEFSGKIAREMGLPKKKIQLLMKAAQLHDIGKLGIQDDILNKSDMLSDNEWDLIHKHPVVGEEILKPVFLDEEMLSVIRSHHEHFDGSGYPDGLKGGQISVFAQIVSVADAFDAMTSSRAYKKNLTEEEAVLILKKNSGSQFNPKVVEAFIKALKA